MCNRRSQFNVTHPLTADFGHSDFNAAFFADDAFILHALVFAAQTFVILHRTEDARAEQAITLGLERPVVDGFRLFDFAERPAADTLWRGQTDLDLVEGFRLSQLVGEFGGARAADNSPAALP